MPRYFFRTSLRDASLGAPDGFGEGIELADDHAAWVEATTACGEILKDIDGALRKAGEWRMDVHDAANKPLYTLRLIPEVHQ